MSQENVEIVKAWYDAYNREDWDALVASATLVWTIRNGAIERVTMYQERQDALEDLGLSEQDAHADP